ncbi:hypothetical protein HU200_057698 [Digitaria exilis]|uniref:Uncharacterized protein n=1 Tax=Digitaria exilis TaxID=1010633 RepID=A0A835AD50_9POAL|nr:hypothetical protein HU200_057698 [Digitaria exilis]
MSLRYASRVVLRAAQAAVRARQPPPRPMAAGGAKPGGTAPAAAQRPQGGQVSGAGGARSSVSVDVEKAVAVEKLRRKAQKAENVMHLVCWGPN